MAAGTADGTPDGTPSVSDPVPVTGGIEEAADQPSYRQLGHCGNLRSFYTDCAKTVFRANHDSRRNANCLDDGGDHFNGRR